jgi:hypothetical protein
VDRGEEAALTKVNYQQDYGGNLYLQSQILFYSGQQYLVSSAAQVPHTTGKSDARRTGASYGFRVLGNPVRTGTRCRDLASRYCVGSESGKPRLVGGLVASPIRTAVALRPQSGAAAKLPKKNFDALVIGYYDGEKLIYAARTRNGFTPASRAELFKKLKPLEIKECPFANLPEKKARERPCAAVLSNSHDQR